MCLTTLEHCNKWEPIESRVNFWGAGGICKSQLLSFNWKCSSSTDRAEQSPAVLHGDGGDVCLREKSSNAEKTSQHSRKNALVESQTRLGWSVPLSDHVTLSKVHSSLLTLSLHVSDMRGVGENNPDLE